ncbi:DUF2808 domain-containing protein [Cyanobium sp. Morenito 9A2]|uniref:DUF2808 domain-containing protein n=1 Tax=Cyanobium sp. Morenito 9A2 TaxID=2823718 RepID=UPI0020CB6B86|nr:DUF2808 domain-containing protein [Cyanobium sp. Morenito 9A2]MCP9848253.1 DUF2808 domain-containing protein [Cyanobium sp. Morenito 9A2]
MTSPLAVLRRPLAIAAATAGATLLGGLAVAGGLALLEGTASAPARAQGTPGLLEFRWDNNKDYRRLYYFITDSGRLKRSEYYLILKPKDRKTAILKLSISIPPSFDVKIDPKDVKLCVMKEGGMLSRTRCLEEIPAVVEIPKGGGSIDIFPNTPVSDAKTIGVYINLFNPFNIGMYQFNALAQAPGDVPMAGYLGSWIIQIDPSN